MRIVRLQEDNIELGKQLTLLTARNEQHVKARATF